MRRSDREITDFQELITVMRGCDVCRLALHDEPYPYILPLNFGLEVDGETVRLYFHGANTGTKYDLIAKNPNVAFEMDRGHALILDDEHGNCTMTYESVIGQGRISVVPDADKERALRVLMAQYRAPDFPYSKAVIPATTVMCLTVEHIDAVPYFSASSAMASICSVVLNALRSVWSMCPYTSSFFNVIYPFSFCENIYLSQVLFII